MATTILTAMVAPVSMGHLDIEGLLAEDGRFFVGIPQVAIFCGFEECVSLDLVQFLGIKTTRLTTDHQAEVEAIGLEGFESVLIAAEKIGNEDVAFFRECLVGLSLKQLFHDSLKPWKNPTTGKIRANNPFISKESPSEIFQRNQEERRIEEQKQKQKAVYLYLIADPDRNVCKIGVSTNPKERLRNLQTAYPFPLSLQQTERVSKPFYIERLVHKHLSDHALSGEWFVFSPLKESSLKQIITIAQKSRR